MVEPDNVGLEAHRMKKLFVIIVSLWVMYAYFATAFGLDFVSTAILATLVVGIVEQVMDDKS